MTRAAYGDAAIYSQMAWDSLAEWKQLGERTGLPIFHQLGVLFFTATPGDYFSQTLAVNRRLGLPIQELGPSELRARFPMIDFGDVELGLFEPNFGALMARRAVQALVAEFMGKGGAYVALQAQVSPHQGPLASIALSDGSEFEADAFVVAAGPWLGKIFPELLANRIIATRQEIFYFAAPPGDPGFRPGSMPAWAEFSGDEFHYGFPDLEGAGVKFAHHCEGPVVDPDTQIRLSSDPALQEITAYRDRRFPRLRDAALTKAEVCQYENSSNGDFLIDFHPDMPNVLLVGGGSGHGFKHGPEVGRYAASLLGGDGQIEPRFSLATKNADQKREIH